MTPEGFFAILRVQLGVSELNTPAQFFTLTILGVPQHQSPTRATAAETLAWKEHLLI